jgi:plastocyanin
MFPFRILAAVALMFLSSQAAIGQAPPPVRQIVFSGYYGMPETVQLTAGRPVTLEFVNRSWNRHNFAARKFFASSQILSGDVRKGNVTLEKGQVKRVTLIPAPGRYRSFCVFHRDLGMRGEIVVS